jgi:solute carrier family 25 oxoglutarate transporter 11
MSPITLVATIAVRAHGQVWKQAEPDPVTDCSTQSKPTLTTNLHARKSIKQTGKGQVTGLLQANNRGPATGILKQKEPEPITNFVLRRTTVEPVADFLEQKGRERFPDLGKQRTPPFGHGAADHLVPPVPEGGASVHRVRDGLKTVAAAAASSQLQWRLPSKVDVRENALWKTSKPLLTGALSGMFATAFTQPTDTVKFRLQVAAASGKSVSPFTIVSEAVENEGALVFYKGLSAGLMRQFIYTGGRFGLFDILVERSQDPEFDSVPGFAKKSLCAITAGGLAAAAGNPADLSLVRMQADALLPVDQRRNYRNGPHAIATIAKTEGASGLFRGASLTSTWGMAATFGSLAFNAQTKEVLQEAGAPAPVQVIGGCLIAGVASAFFSLPIDFVKTHVLMMTPNPATGEMPYKGPLDCAAKQLTAGGILRFWAGFPTYYFRIAPQVAIALFMQDKINAMWNALGI